MTEQDTSHLPREGEISPAERYRGYVQFMMDFFPVHLNALGDLPEQKVIDEAQQRRFDEILSDEARIQEMAAAVDRFLTPLADPLRTTIRAHYSLDEPEKGVKSLKQLTAYLGSGTKERLLRRRLSASKGIRNLLTEKHRSIYGFTVSTPNNT